MSIQLTKEEILEVWEEVGHGLTWEEYAKALNKKQIKKIAEWIEDRSTKPHLAGWYFYNRRLAKRLREGIDETILSR